MLDRMMDQQFVLYVLTGVSAAVLLQKIIVSLLYRHLKKETDALPAANDRWIKQLKLKFENTYKVNNRMTDVEVFVDRQLAKLKFFRLGLYGMNTFYRKAQLICILLGGCSYILAARAGRTMADCNTFFVMGILAAVFLQLLDSLSGNSRSEEVVKLNLTDYFENMLLPKLKQEPGSGTGFGTAMTSGQEIRGLCRQEMAASGSAGPVSDSVISVPEEKMEPAGAALSFRAETGGPAGALEPEEPEPPKKNARQRKKEEIAAADIQKRLSRISQSRLSREEEDRIVRDVLKEFLT